MTTRSELLSLAERVEREEPSRGLHADIANATRVFHVTDHPYGPPRFTESLDAAVGLVGDKPYVVRRLDTGRALATIPAKPDVALGSSWKHPAAALTAAALRALALALAQEKTDG